MKKKIFVLILASLTQLYFAQSFNFSPSEYIDYVYPTQSKNFIYKDSNVILCATFDSPNNINFDVNYPGNYLRKLSTSTDSGYLYYTYKLEDGSSYRDYILEAKGIIILCQEEDKNITKISLTDFQKWSAEFWKTIKYDTDLRRYSPTSENGCGVWIYEDGIKSIKSSSFLTEKNDTYSAMNLKDKIYLQTNLEDMNYAYDSITPPWVEGVNGYGIGEWLDIDFKYKSDELQILNGFVDFRRMYLFKENSRVKTILVESENPKFSKEYELEDLVKFNVIKLPEKTDHVRITIKDVYKGEKYDDTCISSILITDPSKPSFEEQQQKIKQILIECGVWEKIEEARPSENGR